MRRYALVIVLLLFIGVLSSCSDEKSKYNFRARQNDTYISEDGSVLLTYKTNEDGKLIRLDIDKLLPIKDMLYYNPLIDYNVVVPDFDGDIFVKPSVGCFMPKELRVPINIEIGSVQYKYNDNYCNYQEVDRYNEYKLSSFAKEYHLTDTILEDKSVNVNIVVFVQQPIETFVEVMTLPHTLETLGVYGIEYGPDYGGPNRRYVNFMNDMKIFEQYMLRYQEGEKAINEIIGDTENVNILNFDQIGDIVALIEDFEDLYEAEIMAIEELENEIGLNPKVEEVEEEPEEEENGDETT